MNVIVLQDSSDTEELQDGSCKETRHSFRDSEHQQADIRVEGEPSLPPFTVYKLEEGEVSCIFVTCSFAPCHVELVHMSICLCVYGLNTSRNAVQLYWITDMLQ
jgi:hypothetical protein